MRLMRSIGIFLPLLLLLNACEGLVQTAPTATPTRTAMPPLEATVTVNPLPPTPISGDFNGSQFSGINNATAASAPANSDLNPENTPIPEVRPELVTISTESGSSLNGELYRPDQLAEGARVPGVLIFSTPFDDWGGFPVLLRDAGFTVLNVQIRIPLLPGDFKAMLDTLSADGTVNGDQIGLIGAESGADSVFLACAEDTRCKAMALLTPSDRTTLLNSAESYNNQPRPLLIFASQDNPDAAQTAQALRLSLRGEDITLQPFDSAGSGTQMLFQRTDMTPFLIDWLRRYLA